MDQISRLFGKKKEPSGRDETASTINIESESGERGEEDDVGLSKLDVDKTSKNLDASPDYGLKFILDDGSERLFTALPIAIGRGRENDLSLADSTVSDLHAVVYFDDAAHDVCIVDQESVNGICIDGLPTRKNILHDGVTIHLGSTKIRFRDTGFIHNH